MRDSSINGTKNKNIYYIGIYIYDYSNTRDFYKKMWLNKKNGA